MAALAPSPSSQLHSYQSPKSRTLNSSHVRSFSGSHIQSHPPGVTISPSKKALLFDASNSSQGSLTKGLMTKKIDFGNFGVKHGMTLSPTTREILSGPRSPNTIARKLEFPDEPFQPIASTSRAVLTNGIVNGVTRSAPPSPVSRKSLTPTHNQVSRKGKETDLAPVKRPHAETPAKSLHAAPISTAWPKPMVGRRRGAGLKNPNMVCYANASLQVMMHTPPLLGIAMEHKEEGCAPAGKGFCATCTIKGMVRNHWLLDKRYYAPDVHHRLARIKKGFNKNKQEDTHEFFRFVTDGFQNTALSKLPKDISEKQKHTTWIYKVWGGKVRSRVLCTRCEKPSDTFDDFLDLSLDINQQGPKHAETMLKGFIKQDKLEGQNKYHCENCKAKTVATKGMKIAEAPPILTLHLKRFTIDYNTRNGTPRATKFVPPIFFPENLDISPYMVDPSKPGNKYRLFGVTCHSGSTQQYGHYYSHVKSPNGSWFRADDESMDAETIQDVLAEKCAYLLSYIRVDDNNTSNDAASTEDYDVAMSEQQSDESSSDGLDDKRRTNKARKVTPDSLKKRPSSNEDSDSEQEELESPPKSNKTRKVSPGQKKVKETDEGSGSEFEPSRTSKVKNHRKLSPGNGKRKRSNDDDSGSDYETIRKTKNNKNRITSPVEGKRKRSADEEDENNAEDREVIRKLKVKKNSKTPSPVGPIDTFNASNDKVNVSNVNKPVAIEKVNILQPRAVAPSVSSPISRPAHPAPPFINGHVNGVLKVNGNTFGAPPSIGERLFTSNLHSAAPSTPIDPNSSRATFGGSPALSNFDNEMDDFDAARQPVIHSRQNSHQSPSKFKSHHHGSPMSHGKDRNEPDFGFNKKKKDRGDKKKGHGAPMPFKAGKQLKKGVLNNMQGKAQ